jgi:hypothetical protein
LHTLPVGRLPPRPAEGGDLARPFGRWGAVFPILTRHSDRSATPTRDRRLGSESHSFRRATGHRVCGQDRSGTLSGVLCWICGGCGAPLAITSTASGASTSGIASTAVCVAARCVCARQRRSPPSIGCRQSGNANGSASPEPERVEAHWGLRRRAQCIPTAAGRAQKREHDGLAHRGVGDNSLPRLQCPCTVPYP